MTRNDLNLLLGAVGALLALGINPGAVLAETIAFLIWHCVD
jgi:hypothetical protein